MADQPHSTLPIVDFTAEESRAIVRFRERIADVLHHEHDDLDLLKWIQARQFDLRKAEQMYRQSMQWRKQVSADTILEDYNVPEVLRRYFPSVMKVVGHDKEGRPLFIDPTGRVDLAGILAATTREDITRTIIHQLEETRTHLRARSRETGIWVHQVVQILDMDGLGMHHMSFSAAGIYKNILQMMQDNYPNMLKKTFIINVPGVFHKIYKILSAVMDEHTRNKFSITTDNGRDQLLADIDPSQLPVFYGGTMTDSDGDPMCKSKICYGGKVPEDLYLQNINRATTSM